MLALLSGYVTFSTLLVTVLGVVVLAAFVHALTRSEQAFAAAGKLTKKGWLLLLGLSAAAFVLSSGFGLLEFAGIVAGLVYWVDVRPALRRV